MARCRVNRAVAVRRDAGCKRFAPWKGFSPEGIPTLLSVLKPFRVCLATLLALVIQFSLGMILNLYVTVPASDQRASFMQEVKTAPFTLTVHVLIGLVLIGAAGVFMIRAIGTGDRLVIALAAAGLGAILGAFAAGETFVRDGQTSMSLTMTVLTGAALACYIAALARLGAARQQGEGAEARATGAA
jgi:hypothetical protein